MISWGLVGNSHDASLAIFEHLDLKWAALAKDFSDIPNDPHINRQLVKRAMDLYGGPSNVFWYEKPMLKSIRQLIAGQGWLFGENNIRKYLKDYVGYCMPIVYTQHHLSHAAYTYYTQPHDECAVICLDSIGEFETLTIWHGKNKKLKKVYSQGYPHSLGLFYSAMTQRVGLVPQRDEYMIAKMAQKGDPHRLLHIMLQEIIDLPPGFSPKIKMHINLHRGCRWWRPELKTQKDMNDIAAATQLCFELALEALSVYAYRTTGCQNLALAGGGALNKQAVDKISKDWNSVWVPPNPGDPGSCIGAVLAHTKQKTSLDNIWYKKV